MDNILFNIGMDYMELEYVKWWEWEHCPISWKCEISQSSCIG